MKNTFGQSVCVTLFGESHGPAVGAVIDGLSPGLPIHADGIARQLTRRRPKDSLDTARCEPDSFELLSGVYAGKATGTPICILIPNTDAQPHDYRHGIARPSHADYSAFCKYHGYEDYRGGGHFSGRLTAALAAVGGILLPALDNLGIMLGSHILQSGTAADRPIRCEADVRFLGTSDDPVLDERFRQQFQTMLLQAKAHGDSLGGITQTAIYGLPAGLGEPWFDSMEGVLSHALYSLGGIKGVEFGLGFSFSGETGSACCDELREQSGQVVTLTNNNGGINGGITNGMPVVFRCAVKPTPSIARPQRTIDFLRGENTEITIQGRHDPAIIRRICPVIDSVSAIVLCDLLAQRYGTDVLVKGF